MSQELNIESVGIPSDCEPPIAKAVHYWRSIAPAEALPGRQHLDPADIPALLRYVWLIDVHREPMRFVFRLVGTGVVDYFGQDPTGRNLEEVFDGFANSIAYTDFCEVVKSRAPRWRHGAPVLDHLKEIPWLERVYLPFARNGTDVDMIFCLSIFGNGPGAR